MNVEHWTCPLALRDYPKIVMDHGGGKLSYDLVEHLFLPAFKSPVLRNLGDSSVLTVPHGRLAYSTDSFVVHPLFFPGGSIGELAVNGTVNNLAMSGAQALYLSAAFILEEGFLLDDLGRIAERMAKAAAQAGAQIVTGDIKVVEQGHGHGCYINTSGIGVVPDGVSIGPSRARPGDAIIVSGTLGDHGMAVMTIRETPEPDPPIQSDCAPLSGLVADLLTAGGIHVLRDPTRGGVASALNAIALQSRVGMAIREADVPVRDATRAACIRLGLDPLSVASAGRLIAIVAPERADRIMERMYRNPVAEDARVIGRVTEKHPGVVVSDSPEGATRVVPMPSGERLARVY